MYDHFAFVQAARLTAFGALARGLAPAGYRPVRVRPYVTPAGVMVAAVWQRDGMAWELLGPVSAADLAARGAELERAGFQAVDVAAWVDPAPDQSFGPSRQWRAGPGRSLPRPTPLSPSLPCSKRPRKGNRSPG